MRDVVFHYHLFKNAGTSVDAMLRANFGERAVAGEVEQVNHARQWRETCAWVHRESEAIAFSSHTAPLPLPIVAGVRVHPILFVRNPLDRIASAYAFERKQGVAGFGSTLARNTAFAGYVEVRLSVPWDRQCRNFHTGRLAQMFPVEEGSERERALRALDALPFVGVVEDYDRSVALLGRWLRETFPDFREAHERHNVGREGHASLEQRLAAMRADLGPMYERLVEANADDMAIYARAVQRLAELEAARPDPRPAAAAS